MGDTAARSSFIMKLQSLAFVLLASAFVVASGDTALEAGKVDIDNLVDGEVDKVDFELDAQKELAKQDLDRENGEPLQENEGEESEDRDDLDIISLVDGELDSIFEEERNLDRTAGQELMVSDRLSWGKIKKRIRKAVRKALRKQLRRLTRGFRNSMNRLRRNLKRGMRRTLRRTISRVRHSLTRRWKRIVANVKKNFRNNLKQKLEKAMKSGVGKLLGNTAMTKIKEVRACYNLAKDIGALVG